MTAWVGPLGGLVAVEYASAVKAATERQATYRLTLGGRRKAQLGKRGLRELQIDHDMSRPEEFANVAALVAGEFGSGPFWWVDPWAQVTNLLTPAASTLAAGTWAVSSGGTAVAAGGVALADGGRVGRSVLVGATTDTVYVPRRDGARDDVPVLPRQPVTASAWVTGESPVAIRIQWVDAAGAPISTSTTGYTPGPIPTRCWSTGVAPDGAVACYLAVTGATRIARPAITWTDSLLPWHVGQGMPRVVLTQLDQEPTTADPGTNRQWASASYSVTEVG